MDANFGDTKYKYSVVIESTPAVRGYGWATIYCQDGSNFAQLGYGTNRIYPNATYLVYRIYVLPSYSWTFMDNSYGRGAGITTFIGD